MKSLLTPKNDYVFKTLFSRNPEILTDLINCVLQPVEQKRITAVEILNPGILPEELQEKFIILDVRAKDRNGNEYDIEMQVRQYDNYPKRTLYYLSRMYVEQLKTGNDYLMLKPVIGIHFLDYEHFIGHFDFHYRFSFSDARYPELVFTDDFLLHILELPGIKTKLLSWQDTSLSEWLHFFNHAHEEGDKTMQKQYANPNIHKAFDVLTALSLNEKERRIAEVREKALKDEVSFLASERRKGQREERKLIVSRLLGMNTLSLTDIAKVSGLRVEEIRQMEKELLSSNNLPEV